MNGHPRKNSYDVDDFDRDAAANSETRVVNVSPFTARFEVAGTPGSPPRRYTLAPGASVHLPSGYCFDFQGAGRQPVRATIKSLTEREVFPGGRPLPMVVHENEARDYAEQWRAEQARANLPPPPVDVMLPNANGGEPIKMTVQPAAPAAAMRQQPVPDYDDEDQDGPMDEPPPDHNDPLPVVTTPAATDAKGKAKSK